MSFRGRRSLQEGARAARRGGRYGMAPPTILLVEDNSVFRRAARAALEAAGHAVLEASTGTEALALARGTPPSLLLLDTTLPDFRPLDLLKRLRGLPGCEGIPAAGLLGVLARPEEEGLAAGAFDDFLVKPVEGAALAECAAALLAASPAARGRPGRGRRVLVADDDPDHLALARMRFTLAGFVVETAADGQEALEKAHRRRPEVVASDVLMPRLDGIGLCVAIRRDPDLARVPVILFSGTCVEKADQRLAFDAGATAFVPRSGDLRELVEKAIECCGGPPGAAEPIPPAALEEERRAREARQRERLASLHIALSRRTRLQQAQLAILASVAEGLALPGDPEGSLREAFAAGFDSWALCPAALYTVRDGGAPVFRARSGYGPEAEAALEGFFGHRELAARAAEAEGPVAVRRTGDRRAAEDDFLEAAGARSALLVPLRAGGDSLGVLLLASPRDELDDPEVRAFAATVAGQLAQAVSLERAVARLRTSEERYRAIVANANDALFLLDPQGEVLEVNRQAEELLGRPAADILRHRLRDFAAPDAPDTGWESIERPPAGAPVRVEPVHLSRPEGGAVPAEITASTVRVGSRDLVLAVARDISRRRSLERRLFMAQKMEAVGQLAGGIAHDFNNLLMVVNGYAEILLGRTPEGSPGRHELEEILKAGQKAAALTSQLLGFSRRQVVRPRVLDLPAAVGEMEEDLRRLAGPRAQVEFRHAAGQRPVAIDPAQLEQVLFQLVQNAAESLPEVGGRIAVETAAADLDEAFVRENDGARAGPHVTLAVSDAGRGMDEETLSHAFEPFFTTKETGKGSGLGLATVYGIVKQNGGYVRVESAAGSGTTVRIYLPPVMPVAPPPARARDEAPPSPAGRQETILVVEDEWAVRGLIHQILRPAGYAVLEAASGEDALEIAARYRDRIDLALLDVEMPGMGGRAAARRLRGGRPDLKVLLMSGYPWAPEDAEGDLPDAALLPKPFAPELLLKSVAALLRPTRAR